jgi:hypothetical protein
MPNKREEVVKQEALNTPELNSKQARKKSYRQNMQGSL